MWAQISVNYEKKKNTLTVNCYYIRIRRIQYNLCDTVLRKGIWAQVNLTILGGGIWSGAVRGMYARFVAKGRDVLINVPVIWQTGPNEMPELRRDQIIGDDGGVVSHRVHKRRRTKEQRRREQRPRRRPTSRGYYGCRRHKVLCIYLTHPACFRNIFTRASCDVPVASRRARSIFVPFASNFVVARRKGGNFWKF